VLCLQILYGNRAAAYHRLKKYKLALEDSNVAVSLHEPWVKGHYRRACALAALEDYEEAAEAYERALELCPTDGKLGEKAKQMRGKAKAKTNGAATVAPEAAPTPKPVPAPEPAATLSPSLKPPVPPASTSFASASSASSAFSGSIVEHEATEKVPPTAVSAPGAPVSEPRHSRFHGTNYTGETVTLEPVGEAVSALFACSSTPSIDDL